MAIRASLWPAVSAIAVYQSVPLACGVGLYRQLERATGLRCPHVCVPLPQVGFGSGLATQAERDKVYLWVVLAITLTYICAALLVVVR